MYSKWFCYLQQQRVDLKYCLQKNDREKYWCAKSGKGNELYPC